MQMPDASIMIMIEISCMVTLLVTDKVNDQWDIII